MFKNFVNLIISNMPKFIRVHFYKRVFKRKHGYNVDVKHPRSFSEKLFVKIKCDGKNIGYFNEVDKIKVKEIGRKYGLKAPKTIWSGKKIDKNILSDIRLPFVVKTTIGSGDVKIIRQEKDRYAYIKYFNKMISKSYFKNTGEYPYKGLENLIFIEQYLDFNGESPIDIKIHCFNEGKILIPSAYFDRDTNLNTTIYNAEMGMMDIKIKNDNLKRKFPHPNKFHEIISTCEKMANKYNYVRIDLYVYKGQLYIGEFTFTHGGSYERITPIEMDYKIGEMWNYKGLDKYQKKS